MKNIILILAATVWSYTLPQSHAQQIDQERMDRDIKVAETVLQSLLGINANAFFVPYGKTNGSQYLEGYGVMIHMPSENPFMARSFAVGTFNTGSTANIKNRNNDPYVVSPGTVVSAAGITRDGMAYFAGADSIRQKSEEKILESVQDFLLDYGDLIGQLKENDRILVTQRSFPQKIKMSITYVGQFQGMNANDKISAEIKKSDLNAFKEGKIGREEAKKRIRFSDLKAVSEDEQDLVTFSNMFDRVYRSDLSKTYYSQRPGYFDRIPNLGVIYYLHVFSSIRGQDDRYSMPTLKLNDLSQKERDKQVETLYPLFISELKENILAYGHTLKSLEKEEMLLFYITLTTCDGCSIPASLEVSIPVDDIRAYHAGKLNKEGAMDRFGIREGEKQ